MRFTALLLIFVCASGFGQNIKGRVVNEGKDPVPYASCILLNTSDSTYVTGAVSEKDGGFVIPASSGVIYRLSISCIGYREIMVDCAVGDMGMIVMHTDNTLLDEATVIGRRIKQQANGYSIQLKNSEITKGKQLTGLLSFLPGVTVENEEIKLLSRSPHTIYVDGVAIQDNKELSSVPATQVESIDVSYLAGVDESSHAKGGVIRIKLRKEREDGFNGYLQGGTGVFFSSYGYRGENANNSITAKFGKLTLRNNIVYNRTLYIEDSHENHYFDSEIPNVVSDGKSRAWGKTIYDRLNLTYDFSSRQTLAISGLYYTNRLKTKVWTSYLQNQKSAQSYLNSPNTIDKGQAVMNYTWQMDKGRVLTVMADYLRSSRKTEQRQSEGNVKESASTKQHTDMLRVKPTFGMPVGKGQLNIGGDMQYVYYRDHVAGSGKMEADAVRTTMKGYQPAFFVDYSGSIAQRWMVGLGARIQGNITKVGVENRTDRKEGWEFCPMASAMYMLSPQKGHMIGLQFKRSVEDLPYSVISSYKRFTSPQTYEVGNPGLTFPKNNELMATLGLYNQLSILVGGVYVTDPIYYSTEIDDDMEDVSHTIPRNGEHQLAMMYGIEEAFSPAKWWQSKLRVTFVVNSLKTPDWSVNGQGHWSFNFYNSFHFSKTFGGELDFQYEPDCHYSDMKMNSVGSIEGSLYKNFFSEQLEVRVFAKPYQKGRKLITETDEGYVLSHLNRTKNHYATVTVTWYFRGGKKIKAGQSAQSIQDYKQYESDKR